MIRRGIKSLIEWRDSHSCQLPISVIILGLMLAVTLLITRNIGGNPVKEERDQNYASEMRESFAQPYPTMEFVNGTEVIWKIPTDPKAVLFLAHGSGGSARNFGRDVQLVQNVWGCLKKTKLYLMHLLESMLFLSYQALKSSGPSGTRE